MSDSDEGKPKEFFQVRLLKIVAGVKVRDLRKDLSAAEAEYRQHQKRLEELCPHRHVTECKRYFVDAPYGDATDEIILARRRCDDCGLLEEEDLGGEPADRKLFARPADRTVLPEEFHDIIMNARP